MPTATALIGCNRHQRFKRKFPFRHPLLQPIKSLVIPVRKKTILTGTLLYIPSMKVVNRAVFGLLIICIHFALLPKVVAQSNAFDSARLFISSEVAARDVNKAIALSDSLLDAAQTDLERAKCFMLRATLEDRRGNKELAIKYALDCEKLSKKAGLYEQQLRSAGFLSNLFLNIGLISEARKYLNIVEVNHKKNPDSIIQLLLYQQKAFLALGSKDYELAKEEITKAQQQFELLRHKKKLTPIDESLNYWIAGLAHYNTKNYVAAGLNLKKAKECLRNRQSELKGFIFQAQAAVDIATGRYVKARKELDTALIYLEGSNNFVLRIDIYETLCLYYEAIGDNKNALTYQKLYTTAREQFVQKGNAITNMLINQYNKDLSRKNKRATTLYWISGTLVVLTAAIFCYNLHYRRRQRKLYLDYIQKLNHSTVRLIATQQAANTETDESAEAYEDNKLDEDPEVNDMAAGSPWEDEWEEKQVTDPADESNDEPGEQLLNTLDTLDANNIAAHNQKAPAMSLQMEALILKGLLKLEERKFFLKQEVTLALVASKLKANTRYVSLVINKHKKKDFKNYINELRINYIILQLKNNPEYLDYKIAYLANEAGFPSHSKFATVFKSITGMPPSSFIENIRKDSKR